MKLGLVEILAHADKNRVLDITPAAQVLYENWYLNLEQSIHARRLDTYALRFMILLAVNAKKTEIDEAIVRDVIDLMNWQLKARQLHDPIDADSAIAKIEEKIRRVLDKSPRTELNLKRAVHHSRIGSWVYSIALKNCQKENEIQFDKKTGIWSRIQ